MRVLHIYPANDLMIAQYVSILAKEVNIDIDSVSDIKMLQKAFQEHKPDIVHQHGCNVPGITEASLWARKQGARIVLTPHGQLEPWEAQLSHFHKMRMQSLTSHVYAFIARGPIEKKELMHDNASNRIAMVLNPIVTRTTTTEEFHEQHRHIYCRVMDSNVLELMDETTRQAFHVLLKAGITGSEHWVTLFDSAAVNWHRLIIYARMEGVINYIERGMLVLGINVNTETDISCFVPDNYAKPEPLSGLPVVELIRTIRQQCETNRLALLQLAELDVALRRDDMEDDVLMQQLQAEHLNDFFSSLLTVLSQQTGLDEGFMPCEPANNTETKRISNIIKKHLEI